MNHASIMLNKQSTLQRRPEYGIMYVKGKNCKTIPYIVLAVCTYEVKV